MAEKQTSKKVKLKKPVVRRTRVESQKPIISIGTLVTLVVFGFVVLLGVYLNRQKETDISAEEEFPVEQVTFLLDGVDAKVSSIDVKPAGQDSLKLVKDDQETWTFEMPEKAEADQGLVQSAIAQITALQVVTTLPADADPTIFGLKEPAYVISLGFSDGTTRLLEVGSATPSNSGYYVRVDKKDIVVLDLSGVDALTQLVEFPPYVATPTLEVAPTLEMTPTPEASPISTEASPVEPTPTP